MSKILTDVHPNKQEVYPFTSGHVHGDAMGYNDTTRFTEFTKESGTTSSTTQQFTDGDERSMLTKLDVYRNRLEDRGKHNELDGATGSIKITPSNPSPYIKMTRKLSPRKYLVSY